MGVITGLLILDLFSQTIPHNPDRGYIYVLRSPYGYKIGKTKNPTKRLNHFGVKLPFETEVIILKETKNYHLTERELHEKFMHKRIRGEWFQLNERDLKYIRSIN